MLPFRIRERKENSMAQLPTYAGMRAQIKKRKKKHKKESSCHFLNHFKEILSADQKDVQSKLSERRAPFLSHCVTDYLKQRLEHHHSDS